MRKVAIALVGPLLLASSFPAAKYELAARFAAALVRGDMRQARSMLVAEPTLHNWTGETKSLFELAKYMQECPIKSIEGNEDTNINVNLDCAEDYHGMSIEFSGNKIREVGFGPPPPRINLVPMAPGKP